MSLIVVEGVDASGKSTLLENARLAIKKRYFVLMRHSCRPLHIAEALAFMRTVDYASFHFGLDVIADRHPLISEPIYGPILRGKHLFEEHQTLKDEVQRIEDLRNSIDRVIYCRPPYEVMRKNIDNNPQLEWVKERFDALLGEYEDLMDRLAKSDIPVIRYDWVNDKGTLEDLFFGEIK